MRAPGVISAGWMGVLSGPRQRPIWRNRDPDPFPPVVRVFSLRGNAGRTPALHGPSRMGLVSEAGAHPTARPRRNQKPPGSCFFLGPESSPVRLKFKAWYRSRYRRAIEWGSSKFLRVCHIRNAEELTSLRRRDPRISQVRIIFALVGIVRFLCQRRAPCGRFPGGLTFGSHLVCPIAVCP